MSISTSEIVEIEKAEIITPEKLVSEIWNFGWVGDDEKQTRLLQDLTTYLIALDTRTVTKRTTPDELCRRDFTLMRSALEKLIRPSGLHLEIKELNPGRLPLIMVSNDKYALTS